MIDMRDISQIGHDIFNGYLSGNWDWTGIRVREFETSLKFRFTRNQSTKWTLISCIVVDSAIKFEIPGAPLNNKD